MATIACSFRCKGFPKSPARSAVTDVQLRLLKHRLKLTKLPDTASEALRAIARLGGHIANNGDPGWLTLGRGFEKLLLLEAGWHAAAQALKQDPINP